MKSQTIRNLFLSLGGICLIVITIFFLKNNTDLNGEYNNQAASMSLVPTPVMSNTATPSTGVFTTELIFFKAVSQGEEVFLSWDAANELELVGFQIERAGDSLAFERIGWVYSREISRELFYEFFDENVIPGHSYYYRLKMVEFDGAMEYSPVIKPLNFIQ